MPPRKHPPEIRGLTALTNWYVAWTALVPSFLRKLWFSNQDNWASLVQSSVACFLDLLAVKRIADPADEFGDREHKSPSL